MLPKTRHRSRKPPFGKHEQDELKRLHEQDLLGEQIALQMGRSPASIYRWEAKLGLKRKHKRANQYIAQRNAILKEAGKIFGATS